MTDGYPLKIDPDAIQVGDTFTIGENTYAWGPSSLEAFRSACRMFSETGTWLAPGIGEGRIGRISVHVASETGIRFGLFTTIELYEAMVEVQHSAESAPTDEQT